MQASNMAESRNLPGQQVWLTPEQNNESLLQKKTKNEYKSVRAVPRYAQPTDVDLLSNQGGHAGAKVPTKPFALTVLAPQLMSLFNTTMSNQTPFGEIVKVLEAIPNLDFDADLLRSSALGIYYETSQRVQFRLGLFLNPHKETVLDCRRLKGDSFVMGNFFTILTNKLGEKPELGVKVVYDDIDEEEMDFFDNDDDNDVKDLDSLFGGGHLQLQKDPKLVIHLMKEIETSDLETQVNDTGLLAHAAELDSNVDTLASQGGEPLVKLLEGKLRVDNAALVRQSAVLLKELTRMHPEIFSEQTAKSMVKAMGKWAPKGNSETKQCSELVSSRTTVTNLAQGISSLMNSQRDFVKSIKLDEDSVTGIISTLQKYPSPVFEPVVAWMSEMVC